jgi:tetraacyldisaccharide 4'-kinase
LIEALPRCWYERCPVWLWPFHVLLAIPLSLIFALLVQLRRVLYRYGWLRVERLPVPVIVVGNLNVGGSGKTPLTIALAQWLRQAGYVPGIVSRGYGGSATEPMPVMPDSDPALVGDEPVLLARRGHCPVWIGRKRPEAARKLLALHPEVDVLIADDGLQHLALWRDLELVVVDSARGFGNRRLLPAGPLREPLSRLARVDAVVVNGGPTPALPDNLPSFTMRLVATRFVNLAEPSHALSASQFVADAAVAHAANPPHAIAGIGHPQRFFDQLLALGLHPVPHAFADHHAYVASDLPSGTVLMTEKDAVKCAALGKTLARQDLWFLAVDADIDAGLQTLIIANLNRRKRTPHGSQTA